MTRLLQQFFPKEFFEHPRHFRGMGLGLMVVAILILQLFTFEKFFSVVYGFGLPGGEIVAQVITATIPLIEAMSLPYLFSIAIQRKFWNISKIATIYTPIMWLIISMWQNFSSQADRTNTGLFGATIPTVVGLWGILFCVLWIWAMVLTVRELTPRSVK